MTQPLFKIGDQVPVYEGLTDKIETGTIIAVPEWLECIDGKFRWFYQVMTDTRYACEKKKCIGCGDEMRYPYPNELFQYYYEENGVLHYGNSFMK